MKNIVKRWKGLFLGTCFMLYLLSVTVMAADLEEDFGGIFGDGNAAEYAIVMEESDYVYTGKGITPEIIVAKVDGTGVVVEDTVLDPKTDYDVSYVNTHTLFSTFIQSFVLP